MCSCPLPTGDPDVPESESIPIMSRGLLETVLAADARDSGQLGLSGV